MLLNNNFIFFGLKFFVFFLFFFFLGRGLIFCFTKFENTDEFKIAGLNIHIFYPVIGVIFYGNFLFLLNFFLPLNTRYISLFALFLIPNFFVVPNFWFLKKEFKHLLIYIFLLIPSYNLTYHYDSGLYHLNYQALLRESNIILGVSNIYGPYGIGSIYEYISASLWFDSTMVLLQFVNLLFIILFYDFLINLLNKKNNNFLNSAGLGLLIFSILDNFGVGGGRNGYLYVQSLGKQDITLAIMYLITAVMIFLILSKNKLNKNEILIISIFTLFIVQLKVSGVTIFLIYLVFLYRVFRNGSSRKNIFLDLSIPFLLGVFWIFKSILQTGCVIFPLDASCIKTLSWYSAENIKVTLESGQDFSIAYNFNSSILVWFSKFLEYDINGTIVKNFIISFFIIFIIFFKRNSYNQTKNINILNLIILFNILFFLYYGPHFRYLIATQLISIFLIGYIRAPRINLNNFLIYPLVVISVISLVRLDSYKSFNFLEHPKHEIPIPGLKEYDNRYLPEIGDQCWAIKDCSPNRMYYDIRDSGFFSIVEFREE